MSSGPNLPANPPNAYNYQFQPSADIASMQGIAGLGQMNYPAQNYGSFATAAAPILSGAYGGPAITQAGSNLVGGSNQFAPFISQALTQGFDPQSQLYNRLRQQNVDQTRVGEAARGIATTPYGAGVESQADTNFNTAWQQNLLNRMLQGTQIAGGLQGAQGQGATTGAGLLQSAAGYPLQALSQLNQAGLQAGQIPQQVIQDYLAYLSGGTGATQAGTGQYSAESQAALGEQQQQAAGLAGLGQFGGSMFASMFPQGMTSAGTVSSMLPMLFAV
jgi:hypothetical protein